MSYKAAALPVALAAWAVAGLLVSAERAVVEALPALGVAVVALVVGSGVLLMAAFYLDAAPGDT